MKWNKGLHKLFPKDIRIAILNLFQIITAMKKRRLLPQLCIPPSDILCVISMYIATSLEHQTVVLV